jgi:hypothetical protein
MSSHGNDDTAEKPHDLSKPSEAYLGGMFWDWRPEHHRYTGGGSASPKAQTPAYLVSRLAQPYQDKLFFVGEATNLPGATAHAALESGVRAAGYVAKLLIEEAQ